MLSEVGAWHGGPVWRVKSGEFSSNAYLCLSGGSECLLIDGGLDPGAIDSAMGSLGVEPTAVLCTHGHFDHVGAARYMQDKYAIPVYLHKLDGKVMQSSNFLLMAFKLSSRIKLPRDITWIQGDQVLDVSGHVITFHWTPGHTPGSCLIELSGVLFTGDTIYAQGIGLSHLPGEDSVRLRESIRKSLHLLTDERLVCPGHGRCSLGGDIRSTNLQLREFIGLSEC